MRGLEPFGSAPLPQRRPQETVNHVRDGTPLIYCETLDLVVAFAPEFDSAPHGSSLIPAPVCVNKKPLDTWRMAHYAPHMDTAGREPQMQTVILTEAQIAHRGQGERMMVASWRAMAADTSDPEMQNVARNLLAARGLAVS